MTELLVTTVSLPVRPVYAYYSRYVAKIRRREKKAKIEEKRGEWLPFNARENGARGV